MSKRDIGLYLQDIISSIQKIQKYSRGLSFDEFIKDGKTADAVIRNLEIIGEAACHIPESFQEDCGGIPWRQMKSMRHKVVHEYFGVDLEILWKTIKEDLPELKKKIKKIL